MPEIEYIVLGVNHTEEHEDLIIELMVEICEELYDQHGYFSIKILPN